ncbi:MAG: hypothetical protein LBK61_14605 [Spirochaetaceae bacterium]|nr:hypothetical protein [Spirochaetaceae bacterium]
MAALIAIIPVPGGGTGPSSGRDVEYEMLQDWGLRHFHCSMAKHGVNGQ